MNPAIPRAAGIVILAVGLAGLIYLYSGQVAWAGESVWTWRCVAGVGLFGGGAILGQSFRSRPAPDE